MIDKYKVPAEQLKVTYDMSRAGFKTTDDLEPLKGIIGQDRAIRALEFGLQTNRRGYHIYVSGQSGTGRNSFVHHLTSEKASNRDVPKDWIYVYNFNDSNKPLAIGLNSGDGKAFKEEIEHMISGIRKDIENAFESKDYESMKNALFKQYDDESKNLIQELNKIAEKFDFRFFQTDKGLMSTPLKDGEPMKEEEYRSLSKEDYENLREKSNSLGLETVDIFNEIKDLEEEYQKRFKNLDNEFGAKIIDIYIEKIKNKFSYCTKAVEYCSMLREDIIEHISNFKKGDEDRNNPLAILQITSSPEAFFKRYNVNLFVDNSSRTCAPVIIENHPTYKNLLGSIDYKMEMGIARTDFTYIKSGSLHQANGGYIILQVSEILSNAFAWEGLMRALITSEICIEGVESQYGFASPLALKPEPIPLDVKVILIGNPYIYSLLLNYDEKFEKLFKIKADFDTEMDNTEENIVKMARLISDQCKKVNLKPFDVQAVAKIMEYSTRMTAHQKRLSTQFSKVMDLLFEADAWANCDDSQIVSLKHVEKAIEEKIYRSNRYEERTLELFEEGDYLMELEGEKIGEIVGLAVISTGEYSFGKPSKITATTYRGKSGLINIEREARISGNIHDKGVMIINGYLGYKYAQDKPLALSASIVFEQSYSGVDGDSASSTELYAILSSLSEVPIKQYIAVTGSVNQKGEIQPIGGVNEKIEGFYKVCKIKGLNGKHGVIIPHQNVKNLMLNDEVIEAVKEGKFTIYAVKNVDEGVEILTGIPAGTIGDNDKYPKGSIHALVDEKLRKYANDAPKITRKKKTETK